MHHFNLFSLGCIAVGKLSIVEILASSCTGLPIPCDRHKAIVEAEDRYKSELRKSLIQNKSN